MQESFVGSSDVQVLLCLEQTDPILRFKPDITQPHLHLQLHLQGDGCSLTFPQATQTPYSQPCFQLWLTNAKCQVTQPNTRHFASGSTSEKVCNLHQVSSDGVRGGLIKDLSPFPLERWSGTDW